MDWVRVDANTPLHPKVGRLARRLGVGRVQALGHVLSLWCWSIQHAAHGQFGELDAEEIAEAGQWDGDPSAFVAGLQASGWLDEDKALHEWEMYQGKSARVNLMAQIRQDRKRKRDASVTQAYSKRDTGVTRSVEDGLDVEDVEKAGAPPPPEPVARHPFIVIPLAGADCHHVTEDDVLELESAYPLIDVRQELRELRAWNMANPSKRKRRSGIRRHINSWMAAEQDKRRPRGCTERQEAIPEPRDDVSVARDLSPLMRAELIARAREALTVAEADERDDDAEFYRRKLKALEAAEGVA